MRSQLSARREPDAILMRERIDVDTIFNQEGYAGGRRAPVQDQLSSLWLDVDEEASRLHCERLRCSRERTCTPVSVFVNISPSSKPAACRPITTLNVKLLDDCQHAVASHVDA